MKGGLHPLIAQLLNVFAQKVFQPAPGAHQFRGATAERSAKKRRAGSYGRGLANHFAAEARKRQAVRDVHPREDEHGAYTLTGQYADGYERRYDRHIRPAVARESE